MFAGGSNFNLSEDQIRDLHNMLDPENGPSKMAFKRPETQTVGYSLSEAPSAAAAAGASTAVENNVGNMGTPAAAATPGGIYVPPSVGQNNPHLPVVSGSKAAKAKGAEEAKKAKPKGNAIWADDEVDGTYGSALGGALASAAAQAADTREVPDYDVLYQQSQSAEDTYLGADFTKDGSAAMAEGLVVKVKLPKLDNVKELELDVEAFAMRLRTKAYNLRVDLPAKVIEKKGAAKWDNQAKVLAVTLTTDPTARKVKVMA
uniref:PIH1D1/2/3 CS-like domain-containing protein n=1 Tax=Neobodo designis TaxID=312471 RepID=A0A6U4Q0W0_NEODS|mmetsp:Transcript_1544/g.4942  ORF Transcript_1544/g.4942 Transcript_1544/m.4942 type:complete len:260 (+) Transcript_1544:116-895(+)|eukprot:CAMPEP_0174828738 /NCGR_PEP_ID=MMETSP1114-20130205/1512_1 /TAXON_ID=312471 /ORGANISM="Neobodo designis, Strain CCAP 1951/1" /LENGTH=259 /DNA_ID=CAMNT_0016062463 /DNA_START=116 /DNA_END=895 /DNA_ORIENTATION=+